MDEAVPSVADLEVQRLDRGRMQAIATPRSLQHPLPTQLGHRGRDGHARHADQRGDLLVAQLGVEAQPVGILVLGDAEAPSLVEQRLGNPHLDRSVVGADLIAAAEQRLGEAINDSLWNCPRDIGQVTASPSATASAR